MTKAEFIKYQKTGKYEYHPVIIVEDPELYEFIPNQSASIEELLKRQAAGLPLPNLTATIHTQYNGYALDNVPESANISADIIDIEKAYKSTKQTILDTEDAYAAEKDYYKQ